MYYNIAESGGRIKQLRKSRGLTQEAFAEKVGLSYRSISDIERGYRGTSIDALIEMRNILNTTLDYLILGNVKNKNDFTEEDSTILSLLSCKSKEQKILARKILKGILENIQYLLRDLAIQIYLCKCLNLKTFVKVYFFIFKY